MTSEHEQLLRESIARNLAAVLSLPSAGMLRHCKSRLLAEVEGTLLLESAENEKILIDAVIRSGELCGVSFKTGNYKAVFAAKIFRAVPGFQVKDGLCVNALALQWPEELKCAQRRSNYRVLVPKESGISIRVWRLMERMNVRDQPPASQLVNVELRDLSIGGAGVRFIGVDKAPPKVSVEDRLRIELKTPTDVFLVEGKMRPPTAVPSPDVFVTGIAFKKLDNDLAGRQTAAKLSKILGELQREELRRYRLGLMRPPAA